MNPARVLLPLWVASFAAAQPTVVATGLESPLKVIFTQGGNLLVAEAGRLPNTGRVSILTRGGSRRTLLEALPSGLDVENNPIGPTGMALRGQRLYVLIGIGDALRRGAAPGTEVANPEGPSSGLLSSLWSFEFSQPVDTVTGPLRVGLADQIRLLDGEESTINDEVGNTALVRLIADFRDFVPEPGRGVRGSDPYGLALDPADPDLAYVADAGMNAVLSVHLGTGRYRTLAKFAPLPHGLRIGPPVAEAVPTQVLLSGRFLLVPLFSGFPFPPAETRVVSVDTASGEQNLFLSGLSTPIDIARRDAGGRTQYFVLEHSASLLEGGPGRLRQYNTGLGEVIEEGLARPTSMALDPASGEIFVTELGPGRLVKVQAR
jgi:hypothetical protein